MAGENYDKANFKLNPCAASFGGVILGGTDGPVNIAKEVKTEIITCNQAQGRALGERVTMIKYKVKAKFKEISKILPLFGENITVADIGKDLYTDAKVLILTEIGAGATLTHTFHSAIARPDHSYDVDGEKEHGIEVTFETTECGAADGKIYTKGTIAAG